MAVVIKEGEGGMGRMCNSKRIKKKYNTFLKLKKFGVKT